MPPISSGAREEITPEEQERAEALKQEVVEPYLKRYFPFVDLNHPEVRVEQRARFLPKHSAVADDYPQEKPAIFCFTYASPPDSPLKRMVQIFVEASGEGKIVHVAASK
jgi:hypothetical protein